VGEERHVLLRASARRAAPVILLVALYLAFRAETGGALQGGALAALALVLHALLFGAAATLVAFPPAALRIAMAGGLTILLAGALIEIPNQPARLMVIDFGLFTSIAASFALGFFAIAGRAHELRDGDW
jgi:multisubunit Na+/H+ antiporter MnhB subunit